jgi:hypothetical protein
LIRKVRLIALVPVFLLGAAAWADVIEVNLKLPLRPRLPLSGDQKLAIAPFIIVMTDQEARTDRGAKVDIQSEFARYLKKQVTKATKLQIADVGPTRLPGNTMKELETNRDYWRELSARSGADFILTGVIDFDVEDKSGYRTEEYVSPVDGRTYYRQVLVETTGFVFDIVVAVFDGDTGEKLIEENFRDFKEFDQRNYDEILGLFENLRSLETQLLGIFVAQDTSATRYVITN